MSIQIATSDQVELMRSAGAVVLSTLDFVDDKVGVGAACKRIDRLCREHILSIGAKSAVLGIRGFPSATCLCVNHQVTNAIATDRELRDGDSVNVLIINS